MIAWLDTDDPFPPLDAALAEPSGLLAAGADLSPQRLVAAYSQGIFPWFGARDPILWWSPDPRMVLLPPELYVRRSLRKRLRQRGHDVRVDTAFGQVIEACSAPRNGQPGTWITPEMKDAYCALHALGIAHSVETWIDGQLAGGLYGIALGRVFFGESMFTRAPDASKIAFVHMVRQLERWGFGMIDCQMRTDHLAGFGAREIPRADFAARLAQLLPRGTPDGVAHAGSKAVEMRHTFSVWPDGCRRFDPDICAPHAPAVKDEASPDPQHRRAAGAGCAPDVESATTRR
jgi:leucyl/phenylalanyl-tRNA--protein transferase